MPGVLRCELTESPGGPDGERPRRKREVKGASVTDGQAWAQQGAQSPWEDRLPSLLCHPHPPSLSNTF